MSSETFFAPMSYTSDGLTLRCFQPGDGAALLAAKAPSYEHLRPWMPWAEPESTLQAEEALARRFSARYLLNEDYVLGMWVDDALAGGTGFHLRGRPASDGVAEIGMWIAAPFAGQGWGTRALGAMLAWGFGEWPWERLFWRCDTRNIASVQLARKNGMILEGTHRSDALDVNGDRRDTHYFALLRGEWTA